MSLYEKKMTLNNNILLTLQKVGEVTGSTNRRQ